MENNSLKTLENVKIISVTTPATGVQVAKAKGISKNDVFVRVVFEYEGNNYQASQKVQYLPKSDYEELLNAVSSGETMSLTVNLEKKFFNVYRSATLDEVYQDKETTPKFVTKELSNLF